ncbi:DUF3515 family protein [Flexivirga caeni]|uniref:DUF3515 family protein n=1 Tax=Flexivirga caeni TaxID=2294115 RepID=A0A3M9MCG7_9MICO|nr:DUF3515 family protein [Flexivirga caeni]RNI23262.1 DUF3515 family protein [Flexivirga caeni]
MSRPFLAAAGALGLTVSLAACGTGTVHASPADQAANPLCVKASRQWPATVADQKSRAVSTKSDTVHAWGNPAIIARCGVTSPGPTTAPCVTVDDIDWVGTKLSDGTRYITFGRSPALEVLVPTKYNAFPPLGAFTQAARQIPQGHNRCLG